MTYRKKLIEVAIPLEAINRESAREKSIRHGHPSTMHLWWARRPLATCRAILFASLVDDPSSRPAVFPTVELQDRERQRLFRLLEEVVAWGNADNDEVLDRARAEIVRSCDGDLPRVSDPFCGGGSIPLEAQRLGLEAHGSDLNPVAVLITKALIEIPPRFKDRPPVHPTAGAGARALGSWSRAMGMAEDVRHYGGWMREQAQQAVGELYPSLKLPEQFGGGEALVIAWLWTRTIRCPNPACGLQMPLVRSWRLSAKPGRETWVHPVVDRASNTVRFDIHTGTGAPTDGTIGRQGASCVACDTAVPLTYVRAEGRAGRMKPEMLAVVAEHAGGRIYLPPSEDQVQVALSASPAWKPRGELPTNPRDFKTPNYGMSAFSDLFTDRQLTALSTYCDLVAQAREHIVADSIAAGLPAGARLADGGEGAEAYADAVATYLGLAVSKLADAQTTLVRWKPTMDQAIATFARQAIPMVWDYAESNVFNGAAGDIQTTLRTIERALVGLPAGPAAFVEQRDAQGATVAMSHFSTDPPYYDNIGYADLSDFFYVWLRRALVGIFPDEFSTLLVPKRQELVASPYRFAGGKKEAEAHFEHGLHEAFLRMRDAQDPRFPLTVYYAFKQSEDTGDSNGRAATGWETMLQGLLDAGLGIDGTWPVRSELENRMLASGTNALASSIVLVCRPRVATAAIGTRREFVAALRSELPEAMRALQQANIAPVDLAQAAIGPGMAVFSRYAKVIDATGEPMRVRAVLGLINEALDELVTEQEGALDSDTRWAVAWFEQFGFSLGAFGVAETLSKAKNTSVAGLVDGGLAAAAVGKVRLLRPEELHSGWAPTSARRLTVWETTHQLSRALTEGGERAGGELLRQVGGLADSARTLAYRLYLICERNKWAKEGLSYNSLVIAWPDLVSQAADDGAKEPVQQLLET
jgi:putative DNA methylase